MMLGKALIFVVVIVVIAWMVGGFLRNFRR
jgi:hypothetical protein